MYLERIQPAPEQRFAVYIFLVLMRYWRKPYCMGFVALTSGKRKHARTHAHTHVFLLPVFKIPQYHCWQVLINDETLKNESSPGINPNAYYDRGPAHAYQLPVRIANRNQNQDSTDKTGVNGNLPSSSYDAEAEERLPMRLRGIKAAYGRALGTAGKLCLDKHASTVGGHPDSAAQAWEHLTKAAEVSNGFSMVEVFVMGTTYNIPRLHG